jgi:hypothetical protein
MICRFFVLFFFALASCKTAQKTALSPTSAAPKTVESTLQITSLKVNDLEENLTLQDEVLLAYSLTTFDAQNQSKEVINGTWGIKKVAQKDSFLREDFQPISLQIPHNGKMLASVVLVEIDDYQATQRWLKDAQKVGTLVGVPAVLLEIGTLATPLKYISAGLIAAGAGFELTQKIDSDDILGQINHEVSYAQSLRQPLIKVAVPLKGKKGLTTYNYSLTFELKQTHR